MSTIVFYVVWAFILGMLLYFGGNANKGAFLSMLFGAAFTAFVALYLERQLRPKISIRKEQDPHAKADGRVFLRVNVENRSLCWPLNCIMDRRTAQNVRAWITFFTTDNNLIFKEGRRMTGRWSNTPEPIRPIAVTGASSDAPNVTILWDPSMTSDAVDIASGSSEPLDVAMRTPNETGCHGWNNRIIQRPANIIQPEERFDLKNGRYHVRVQVDVSGRIIEARFRMVCDVGIVDFRLEDIA